MKVAQIRWFFKPMDYFPMTEVQIGIDLEHLHPKTDKILIHKLFYYVGS